MTTHRFAQLLAAATFVLLIAGALVTSTNSGLSVPDWPLSYGTLFPPMVGGIRFEHAHRLIAGAVGLLTLAFAVWCRLREPRRAVRRLGWAAVGVVLAQALLGGITVLKQLPFSVSVAHACLAQLFFGLTVTLAVVTSRAWASPSTTPRASGLTRVSVIACGAVFVQLLLGAALRHNGRVLVPHAAMAVAVAVAVFRLIACVLRQHRDQPVLRRLTTWLALLLLGQLVLGVLAAWLHPTVVVRTAHVIVGALLFAAVVITALWAFRSTPPPARGLPSGRAASLLELTKPRLTLLAVITTAVGFLVGSRGHVHAWLLLRTLLGTALVGGGAAALNQYLERDADAMMPRTRQRPLPTHRLQPNDALTFGVLTAVGGLVYLAVCVDVLTSALGAATLATYLFLYTPLKRVTPLCTLIGAIPGAIPPLMGWSAARHALGPEAWALFAILFLWQLPHFLALAVLYREDYRAAGFRMLTVGDPDGRTTGRQIALYCTALIPATLIPTLLGVNGGWYFFGALGLGLAFCACGVAAAVARSRAGAQRLFLASIAYLPALLTLMTVDHALLLRNL